MAGWIIVFVVFGLGFLWLWMNDIAITNKQFRESCEQVLERERMRLLMDNTEVNEAIHQVKSLRVAEIAQPVSEPSAADLILDSVKEDKW